MSAESPSPRQMLHYVDPDLKTQLDTVLVIQKWDADNLNEVRAGIESTFTTMNKELDINYTKHTIPSLYPDSPEINTYLFYPPGTDAKTGKLPGILKIHCGGYVFNTALTDAGFTHLCTEASGAVMLSVEYRLCPESKFPGPIQDCFSALVWFYNHAAELGVDPERISVQGESAGGGLSASLCLWARDHTELTGGVPIPIRSQFLIFPMLNYKTGSDSYEPHHVVLDEKSPAPIHSHLDAARNAYTGGVIWDRESNIFGWNAMRGGQEITEKEMSYFSPSFASDLTKLPPAFVIVGNADLFLEEDVEYAMKLNANGVSAELHLYTGAPHGFFFVPGELTTQFFEDLTRAYKKLL